VDHRHVPPCLACFFKKVSITFIQAGHNIPLSAHRVAVIPSYWGNTNKRIMVQAGLDIKQDPNSITNIKRARDVTQVGEVLPSKNKTLSQNISTNPNKLIN
jgi:hypothetical protein